MKRSLALALVVALTGSAAADDAPTRVAVVPGIAVNLDSARVDALGQELAQALSSELVVDAIGGLEVRRLLPAEGLPPDCVTTPACTADVAKRTGASQLLFVVMVDSGARGTIQVDTTWVDTTSGKSASRPAIDLTSTADAKATFAAAAMQLLPDARVRAKSPPGGGGGIGLTTKMTEGVPRHLTTPAKITAAVGVVGLGAGIAFGVSTRSKYHRCEDNVVACTQSDRDEIRTFGLVADVGFVVAAGGAIATLVLYMTSAEQPRIVVSPTPDGAGVSAIGRF
jgi:hypothetical protein